MIIVKNEKGDRTIEIDLNTLRGRFENLKESLATNLATNRGLEEILGDIQHNMRKLSHVGSALPKTWKRVRETLEQDERNYISLEEYLKVCEDNGFKQLKDKLQLSGYLHDLGVCLHFQDSTLLKNTVIIKPEWGTDAVYKVLDDKEVINNLGRFTTEDLDNIWSDEQYLFKQAELLELMIRFKLCYQIPGTNDTYIAPQLLTKTKPSYDWDINNNLILRYTYEFMPKGIITQLIVAIHKKIYREYVWRSGVVLVNGYAQAEVIEYYDKREIKIRISGKNKRDLRTIITHELDKIHGSYPRLKYSQLIPCNCSTCKNNQNPHFYDFNKLQEWKINGRQTTQCDNKPYDIVNILSLIDDAIDSQQLINNETIEIDDEKEYLREIVRLQAVKPSQNIINNKNQLEVMNQEGDRSIKIEKGNYNEQRGDNNTISEVNQSSSGSGDNVARDKKTTKIYNSQDLTQAAADIQALLKQLEETYPTNNTMGKMAIASEAIQHIDNDPKLTSRVLSALKAGGTSALESLLDHPAASFVIAALEDWQQSKSN